MFNLILKEDNGIQIITGKVGSGKSKMCQMFAHEFGYLHLDYDRGDFRHFIFPMWCEELETIIIENNHKGLILDCPISILNEYLPDWDKHEWIIPIVVTEQLNRNANMACDIKECTYFRGWSKLSAEMSILRDLLGSAYKFHTINDIDETSPKISCESYIKTIKNAITRIEDVMTEIGYKYENSIME